MVLPVHESTGPEWPKWKRLIGGVAGASAAFAGVWWLMSRDGPGTLVAAVLPWFFAVLCILVALVWSAVTIPLMLAIGRLKRDRPAGTAGRSDGRG